MTLGARGDMIANRYRLEKFIGRGGFGEVWRARDTHRSYDVALKLVLNRDRRATWHEASLLTALRSEHILEVNNADVSVDVPYLDTALAACSLDARAMPTGVEPGLAVDWTRRALRGLDLCHRVRLLHRDIKPHNIFLTAAGDAKLGDFGTACLMDPDGTGDISGDPQIQAPEFFQGGRASVASDIYAMACTLYALVTGRFPYAGIALQADLEAAIIAGDHPHVRDLAPHVSMALADKIRTGMAKDPAQRFASAAAFDNALALPTRNRHIAPIAVHQGHLRCWTVTGSGSDLHVCLLPGNAAKRVAIETRRHPSGRRIRDHCLDTSERDAAKRLRAVFDALRS
ncbi:serine/threonine-protein kinase [Mycobacterium intracellulare]|uniref:serine/threonine-protein kinase n=1 Tax=Mycobacterium intracellulare TaxID=1767 RepID=UPI0015CDB73E|nr:serine/threonine-protein kinase [Mycobacterium intracellulare]